VHTSARARDWPIARGLEQGSMTGNYIQNGPVMGVGFVMLRRMFAGRLAPVAAATL
jgi:hypothetical protein